MNRILIDAYKINNVNSGLGQFSLHFANHLAKLASEQLELNCLVPKGDTAFLDQRYNKVLANFTNRIFPNFSKFDLWHSLHQFPSHLPNESTKQILTIHDLNFLVEKKGSKKDKYLNLLQKRVDRAQVITTISNHTKTEIERNIDLKGKKINMIYNGVSIDNQTNFKKPDYIEDKKFFFSIGIFSKKKNFHTLLNLVKHFDDLVLVIAGNNDTSYGSEIKSLIKEKELEGRVLLPGMISDNDKNWLFQNCEALLFPSLAEGFGLPVIEAMMNGKPAFLSKYGSLPEIGGNQAFYFEDFSESSMISTIKSGLSSVADDPKMFMNNSLKYSSSFGWETSVAKYLELYQEVLNS